MESASHLNEMTLYGHTKIHVFNLLEVSLFPLEAEDPLQKIPYIISRGACPPTPTPPHMP